MHGLLQTSAYRRQRRRRHHHQIRNGHRLAALRALTGARLLEAGEAPGLVAAAEACGSNSHYVRAMVTLLKSEDSTLLERVLDGDMPVLMAGRQVERLACLVESYRKASAGDRVAFAKAIGPTVLFDNTLVPAI